MGRFDKLWKLGVAIENGSMFTIRILRSGVFYIECVFSFPNPDFQHLQFFTFPRLVWHRHILSHMKICIWFPAVPDFTLSQGSPRPGIVTLNIFPGLSLSNRSDVTFQHFSSRPCCNPSYFTQFQNFLPQVRQSESFQLCKSGLSQWCLLDNLVILMYHILVFSFFNIGVFQFHLFLYSISDFPIVQFSIVQIPSCQVWIIRLFFHLFNHFHVKLCGSHGNLRGVKIWWQHLVPTYRVYTAPRYATIPKLTCWHVVSVLLKIWWSAPRYATIPILIWQHDVSVLLNKGSVMVCRSVARGGSYMTLTSDHHATVLPSCLIPHNSGPLQWARGGSGAKDPPLAVRPWWWCVNTSPDSGTTPTHCMRVV